MQMGRIAEDLDDAASLRHGFPVRSSISRRHLATQRYILNPAAACSWA